MNTDLQRGRLASMMAEQIRASRMVSSTTTVPDDIVDWLRRLAGRRRRAFGEDGMKGCRFDEAANEIERLRAELGEKTP
jgi:hypothetical protein